MTVFSDRELDRDEIDAAVTEAGFALADRVSRDARVLACRAVRLRICTRPP